VLNEKLGVMPGGALDSVTRNKGEKYHLDPYSLDVRALGKYFQNGAGSRNCESRERIITTKLVRKNLVCAKLLKSHAFCVVQSEHLHRKTTHQFVKDAPNTVVSYHDVDGSGGQSISQ
jgi:hypothetical protein